MAVTDDTQGGIGGAPIEQQMPQMEQREQGATVVRPARPQSAAERRSVLTAEEMRALLARAQQMDAQHDAITRSLAQVGEAAQTIEALAADNAHLSKQLAQVELGLHEHRTAIETLAARINTVAQQVVSRNTRFSALDEAIKAKGPGTLDEKVIVRMAAEFLRFLEAEPHREPTAFDDVPDRVMSH